MISLALTEVILRLYKNHAFIIFTWAKFSNIINIYLQFINQQL